ncbi:DUF6722 family protein [Parabacteroides merdae]|uniref:DUF6722 family protein n=1 Tax=Parabacteroides merdae TaxID=46503 RepID=UPI003562F1DE
MKEELGKWLIDVAKLIFAGIVLIGVIKSDTIDETTFFLAGGISALACFLAGLTLITSAKKPK